MFRDVNLMTRMGDRNSFVGVSVLYIFMSVNIAERPTFEKRAVHFDRGLFENVICLVLIFTSKAEF